MKTIIRLPVVGVIGSGSEEHDGLAAPLGELLAELNVHLLTGGGPGVMLAVSRAYVRSARNGTGVTIGILPCRENDPQCRAKSGYPNPYVEVVIPTHLPFSGSRGSDPLSRNHINVLASDAIVALPGGLGTTSETRLAIHYQKPIIAFLDHHHIITNLDSRVPIVRSIQDVRTFLESQLRSFAGAAGSEQN